MATFSKEIPDERLKASQVDELSLDFVITGAKTMRQVAGQNAPVITLFDNGDSSQTAVDALLGVASDVTYATSFGSTAMGTDAIGFVIAHGSAMDLVSVEAITYQTAGGTPANTYAIVEGARQATTALANTLTNGCAVTPSGHIYGRVIAANADSTTAGRLKLRIKYRAK
jgi:hypothetical protein